MEDDDEEEDEEEEDEAEEEDEDGDNGKEPRTIGEGEIINTSACDFHTRGDNQPVVRPEHGQEMRKHTPRPQHHAPTAWSQTPELHPQPPTRETYPLSGLEFLGLVMPQNRRLAVPTWREVEAAGKISPVDVNQQLRGQSAGGDSLPNVPFPIFLCVMSLSLRLSQIAR